MDEPNKNYLSSQDNINDDNKLDKIIQATNKLGNLFSKAAEKYKILENKSNPNYKIFYSYKLNRHKIYLLSKIVLHQLVLQGLQSVDALLN